MPTTEAAVIPTKQVLSISPSPDDHLSFRSILNASAWELCAVATCHDAMDCLRLYPVSVIFCEALLEDGTWKDILNLVQGNVDAPMLIVTSRFADAYLWAEVLNLGGFDVLAKPFVQSEVRHVLNNVLHLATRRTILTRTDGPASDPSSNTPTPTHSLSLRVGF